MSSNPPRSDFVAAFEDVLFGNKTLDLKIISWQQFLHGVSRANQKRADDHRIKIRCRPQKHWSEGSIIIGEKQTEDLYNIEFLIEICSAQKVFEDFESENPNSEEGKNMQGILLYHAPISPDSLYGLPDSVIEKHESGSMNGWILFGTDMVREISRLLTLRIEPDIHIEITVKATAAPTPHSLTYETNGYRPTTYRWNGKDGLEITEAVIVVAKAPVSKSETLPEPEERPWWKIGRRR